MGFSTIQIKPLDCTGELVSTNDPVLIPLLGYTIRCATVGREYHSPVKWSKVDNIDRLFIEYGHYFAEFEQLEYKDRFFYQQ